MVDADNLKSKDASEDRERRRRDVESVKESLLAFASAELTSHASNLMGIVLILFTYLTVVCSSGYFPRIQIIWPQHPYDLRILFYYLSIFLIFWFLNSVTIFVVMRLVYYGSFAHQIIISKKKLYRIDALRKEIEGIVNKGHFVKYFSSGISLKGLTMTSLIGIGPSVWLFVVFFNL